MSEVRVNKLSPRSGTTVTLGDSGDTITIPSGVTLANSGTFTNFQSTGIDDNATSTAITIDSSDRVGINTTSPQEKLHIETPTGSASETGLKIRNGTSANDVMAQIKLQGGYAATSNEATAIISGGRESSGNNSKITFSTGGVSQSERMRITSSGNVGIGTSSPDNILMVSSDGASASAQPLSIVNPARYGTNDSVELEFGMGRANDTNNLNFPIIGLQKEQQWQGASTNVDASVIFKSVSNQTASERMRIDSSGNVGIGTTSPSEKLEVNGNILIPNNNALKINDTSGAKIILQVDNFNQTILRNANDTRDICVRNAAGTDIVRFRPNGGIAIGGSFGDANTLDDYEEGTFTTTLTASSSGSITLSYDELAYRKIGSVVYITGEIRVSSISSPSGFMLITNLPFAVADFTDFAERTCGLGYRYHLGTSNSPLLLRAVGGSTSLTVQEVVSGDATNVNASDLQSDSEIIVQMFYFTNA